MSRVPSRRMVLARAGLVVAIGATVAACRYGGLPEQALPTATGDAAGALVEPGQPAAAPPDLGVGRDYLPIALRQAPLAPAGIAPLTRTLPPISGAEAVATVSRQVTGVPGRVVTAPPTVIAPAATAQTPTAPAAAPVEPPARPTRERAPEQPAATAAPPTATDCGCPTGEPTRRPTATDEPEPGEETALPPAPTTAPTTAP
jgi:hypothetical protein